MEFPEYPGVMTWRMRKAMVAWARTYRGPTGETYDKERQLQIQRQWRYECESAVADGILKALRENSYDNHRVEKSDTFMVTVNAKSDVDLKTFTATTDKWVKQKYIQSAEYTYEQRGDTPETTGKGIHVHAIVKTDTNKADFIKRVANTFKACIGSTQAVDVRPIPKKLLEDKRAYLRGVKTHEKMAKVNMDKIWRGLNNLLDLYKTQNGIQETHADEAPQEDNGKEEAPHDKGYHPTD
nr:MAG: replication polyprotein [Owegonang virus 25]